MENISALHYSVVPGHDQPAHDHNLCLTVLAGCKKELGRAVHMAFFIWSQGAILTSPCDQDVAALCLKQRPNMDAVPGAVGSCLADIVSGERGRW